MWRWSIATTRNTPLPGCESGMPSSERVQQAISNTAYGIKAQSNPVTPEARAALLAEAEKLVEQGADAVILGCTEIPLALTEPDLRGVPLLDATKGLARALIIAFAPERLKKA